MSDFHEQVQIKNEELLSQMLDDSLPEFSRRYFSYMKNKGMSSRTLVQYAYDLNIFFTYLQQSSGFKDINLKTASPSVLDRLSIEDLQEFQESIRYHYVSDANGNKKKKLTSDATRARRASSLRSFYKYMVKSRAIQNDMSEFIDIPSVSDHPIVTLDKTDVQRVLATVKDTEGMKQNEKTKHEKVMKRDYAIVVTLLGTGIRVSELVGLNLSDIDFYQASLNVTRKGGDIDEVYFADEVEDALLDYINNERDNLEPSEDAKEALFISLKHKRLCVRSVELMVKKYAKKAGIADKITPHKMRSTYGSNLYDETNDIYLVADALHHSSVEVTRRHYAKMSRDHKRLAQKHSSSLFKTDK